MNVLSCFDGISCGRLALNKAGVKHGAYFASEIDKHAIAVTQKNFPHTQQLGAIQGVTWFGMPRIDLLFAGSPCQDISNLNKFRLGLDGEKSGLFFHFYRLYRDLEPQYFLLENVVGKRESIDKITELLQVEPIRINTLDFLPHSRNRLYWTNIPIAPIVKKESKLSDLLEPDFDNKYYQTAAWNKWWNENKAKQLTKGYSTLDRDYANCLTASMYSSWNGNFLTAEKGIRRLTVNECCRLQGVPDGYCDSISGTQAYKALGNGWTIDVVAHILSYLK